MTASDFRSELVHENATNRRYMEEMEIKSNAAVPISTSRNNQWTRSSLPRLRLPEAHPLVGRVGLACAVDYIEGADFYIGGWHYESGDLRVYSWAAPVATTFFLNGDNPHELVDHVVVRRTLVIEGQEIVHLVDEWVGDRGNGAPFSKTSPLAVPRPPRPASGRRTPAATPRAAQQTGQRRPETDDAAARAASNGTGPKPIGAGSQRRATQQPMRAAPAVLNALRAPRGDRLKSVLATLQPDQYELVTRPSTSPLVIQGHPGTGKTIIAAHRAAYLVHPDRDPGTRLPRVLLIGPTQEYVRHVEGIIRSLNHENGVQVVGLQSWLAELAGMSNVGQGPLDGDIHDVDWSVGTLLESAARHLRAIGKLATPETSQTQAAQLVWEAVRQNGAGKFTLTQDPEKLQWIQSLPEFKKAKQTRRLAAALAQCALAANGLAPASRFDHIVVDEVQDVRPLEWRILDAFNAGDQWTLLGDMNQRRTDHSYLTWQQLADDLAISDPDEPFEPVVFRRGYRSTQPIMAFANRLLPKEERVLDCLQVDGPEPDVVKVGRDQLTFEALSRAEDLAKRYAAGSTAVITVDPHAMVAALRAHQWRGTSQRDGAWVKGNSVIRLATPDHARGVEFDAVVVVEPSAFPRNLGRFGPLYTSLTRANRELNVVHAQPLPDGLRRR